MWNGIHVKARMEVVTDVDSLNFGRPYFVCSKPTNPCRYFAWGDEAIIPRPLCEHGKPCCRRKEWKGPNKGRYSFSCAEPPSYIPGKGRCKFFKWMEPEDEREIDEDVSAEFLRLNDEFPCYPDELLEIMDDARARNEESDLHQEYMEMTSTKETIEKSLRLQRQKKIEEFDLCQEPMETLSTKEAIEKALHLRK